MPEYLRALVVILALATAVFVFAKAPACAESFTAQDFARRRNLWFGITLAAFLAQNFWVFMIVAAAFLLFTAPREPNKMALFFFLLFAVPPIPAEITGLGVIDHFFSIHYVRLLALTVLLPTFLFLRRQPETEQFGRSLPDILIAGYLILQFALQLRADTLTNTMRIGILYAFLDVFLPYYVASRSLKILPQFRDALMAFSIAALVLSAIGGVEATRHWLLYKPLKDALGVPWGMGDYLGRGDLLRAQASTGQPIVLGYVIVVASGFFLYLRRSVSSSTAWYLGMALLLVGLVAPVSRGPWIGAAVLLLVFIATSPFPGKGFAKVGLLAVLVLPVLLITPAGEMLVSLLPFVGSVEDANVTYRQRLLEVSLQLIMQYPFFGSIDYLSTPAMQSMVQGQGIIDIVNTYIGIGLSSGLVGLSIFSGFFIVVVVRVLSGMRSSVDRDDEHYLLGQALLSALLAILVIIFTVSSISTIPVVYWSVAGLGVAYARMSGGVTPSKAELPARLRPMSMKFRV